MLCVSARVCMYMSLIFSIKSGWSTQPPARVHLHYSVCVCFCLCFMCLPVRAVVHWQVRVCDIYSTLAHHTDRYTLCKLSLSRTSLSFLLFPFSASQSLSLSFDTSLILSLFCLSGLPEFGAECLSFGSEC